MSAVAFGLLILRLVVGGIVMARGARKLALLSEGSRPTAASLLRSLRSREPEAGVVAVGGVELAAGLLFASGLFTPLAALAIVAAWLGSVRIGDARDSFWRGDAHSELALVVWATGVAVAGTGAGQFSLDAAIGWAELMSGLGWSLAVLVTPFLLRAGKVALARLPERPRMTQPQDRLGPPEDVSERPDATQAATTRLFGRTARPARALGLGLVRAPSAPARSAPAVEVQLTDTEDATNLIDCLWRHGLGARLVESGNRWAVEVDSPHGSPERLLTDVVETLEIWLLECDRPGLLVRVGEGGLDARTSSASTDGGSA